MLSVDLLSPPLHPLWNVPGWRAFWVWNHHNSFLVKGRYFPKLHPRKWAGTYPTKLLNNSKTFDMWIICCFSVLIPFSITEKFPVLFSPSDKSSCLPNYLNMSFSRELTHSCMGVIQMKVYLLHFLQSWYMGMRILMGILLVLSVLWYLKVACKKIVLPDPEDWLHHMKGWAGSPVSWPARTGPLILH